MVMINEIFSSIQGEGPEVGKYVTFVRFSGCNRSCEFCDSKFASNGVEITIDSIVQAIIDRGIKNIVFTGGEPLMQYNGLVNIVNELSSSCHIALETNGTYHNLPLDMFDLVVVSPKDLSDIQYWISKDVVFKFVVDQDNIIDVVNTIHSHHIEDAYLMPKGTCYEELMINTMLIIDTIRKYKLDAYLGQRLHIMMGLR